MINPRQIQGAVRGIPGLERQGQENILRSARGRGTQGVDEWLSGWQAPGLLSRNPFHFPIELDALCHAAARPSCSAKLTRGPENASNNPRDFLAMETGGASGRMFDSAQGKKIHICSPSAFPHPHLPQIIRPVSSTTLAHQLKINWRKSLMTFFCFPKWCLFFSTGGHHFDTSDFGFEDGGGRGGFGDPFKIFEDFFGGGMGGAGSSKRSGRESPARREIPTQKPLPCTLEELYVSHQSSAARTRRVYPSPLECLTSLQCRFSWQLFHVSWD